MIAAFAASTMAQSGLESPFGNETVKVETKVELFPNPTVDFLNIQITDSRQTKTTFTLHNIIGNELKIQPEKVGDGRYKLNVKNLAPGYYLLAIRDQATKYNKTFKFLKK